MEGIPVVVLDFDEHRGNRQQAVGKISADRDNLVDRTVCWIIDLQELCDLKATGIAGIVFGIGANQGRI